MRWYVYGLTDARSDDAGHLHGLGGHPVQVLGTGPVRLLASRAPEGIEDLATAAPDEAVAAVLQHDEVLVELATDRTVVPARFGTLLADDDAVGQLLADPDGRLAARLERVAGATEWVVSVSVDEEGQDVSGEATGEELSPGHAFFARRRAAADASTRARQRAVAVAEEIDGSLRSLARDFAPLDLRSPDMVARGAYLVPDAAVSALHDLTVDVPDGARVEVQGPLPAYRFAEVEP